MIADEITGTSLTSYCWAILIIGILILIVFIIWAIKYKLDNKRTKRPGLFRTKRRKKKR